MLGLVEALSLDTGMAVFSESNVGPDQASELLRFGLPTSSREELLHP